MENNPALRFLPAIVRDEYDSPIDALVNLCVPLGEAMDLVAASWRAGGDRSVVTTVDGGRAVAAILTPAGRWAACNAFPEYACAHRGEAERRLRKLQKRGRRGLLGQVDEADLAAFRDDEIPA